MSSASAIAIATKPRPDGKEFLDLLAAIDIGLVERARTPASSRAIAFINLEHVIISTRQETLRVPAESEVRISQAPTRRL